MKQVYYYLLLALLLVILSQFFIYSTKLTIADDLHKNQFHEKYRIFSVVPPSNLSFASESVPIYSPDIWERIDKELLKNIYWQSNTMLYFKKANKYFPIIEPILKKYNIPEDFKYLALIESGLDNVVSPAGAAGFWQFLKGTAREYGLEVNASIDERYNLEKSTVAACKYLQQAYHKFGSWTMAAASYNMGQNGARRAIIAQESNNYYNLHLNSETSRYIFRIVAVKHIMENPNEYGFVFRQKDLYSMPDLKTVRIDSTIANLSDFARSHSVNYKLLKVFNPWLRSTSLPDKSRREYFLKIPTDTSLMVFDELQIDSL